MIDFYNGEITDILPDNIKRDPIVQAISYAISKMVKKIVKCADRTGIYASIDLLDEEIVDLLAAELRTKYYGSWMSLEEKRNAVKKTIFWYCRAGTLFTTQELTDFVFQNAKIEEWFQYGSDAFLFRILIDVISQDISLEKYFEFLSSLYGVKNTRSHLEAVIFRYHKETEVKTVAAGGMGSNIKIKARMVKRIQAVPENKNVSALFVNQNIRIHADNSIKQDEVYLLSEDGSKERVLDKNGCIVKMKEGE